MEVYQKTLTVIDDDLDELNHVNNVRYVQWINDIAKEHWLKNATQLLLDSYYWVLINHNIQYKGSAVLNDLVTLKTYVASSEGVTSIRHVEMFNAQNKLLIKSETKWCLMSKSTNKPARITPEIVSLFC